MGITIHYKGEINKPHLIPKLIDDCRDFAENMGWRYHIINEEKIPKLKGIVLNVHSEAEPLNLTFGEDGSLRSCIDYEQTQLFVKTQFAGTEAHITIVKLLKYLKEHYISNLTVYDEGEYWESGDIDKLSGKLSFLQSKIDILKDVFVGARFTPLENVPCKDGDEKRNSLEGTLNPLSSFLTGFTKEESQDIAKLVDKVELILRETFEKKIDETL